MLFSAFRDPQRHHQHLATKVNAIDHQHHQIQILQSSLAQHSQLIATGRYELPAHAAFLDPVAFHNTLHRSPIVPRGQSGHHAFPHRSLQLSVLLQLTVALQLHFLAFPRSHPRPFQRNFLSTENHITRLLSPAHATRCRIGPMRRSYPASDFIFQDGSQNLQPGLPGQLLYLRLHLRPHLGHRQRHTHHQLLPSDDLELVIGLALFPLVFVSHGGSLLLKRDSQPELYPSSGESRCFLFSTFN